MPRSRLLKPSFFMNDTLAECSPLARILFAGLWCHADREGRLEDRPKKLKAQILPYDDCDVDALLKELADASDRPGKPSFILRYSVDGCSYIQILHFLDHQKPHHKERESVIPEPNKSVKGQSPVVAPDEPGQNPGKVGAKPGQGQDSGLRVKGERLRVKEKASTKSKAKAKAKAKSKTKPTKPAGVAQKYYSERFEKMYGFPPDFAAKHWIALSKKVGENITPEEVRKTIDAYWENDYATKQNHPLPLLVSEWSTYRAGSSKAANAPVAPGTSEWKPDVW